MRNSDYGFSATIPVGATGWGAGPGAPFHGFVIYHDEDSDHSACIDLKIGLRIDLPGDIREKADAKTIRVGNLTGTEKRIKDTIRGTSFENVIISLELHKGGDISDLIITLVTPTENREKALKTFETFLTHLDFEKQGP